MPTDDPDEQPARTVRITAHIRFTMTEQDGTVNETVELSDEILEHVLRERFEDVVIEDIHGKGLDD
jgi:hypothetical protein